MSLRVIQPTIIRDENLISSSAPEDTPATWATGTTYAKGDQVRYPSSADGIVYSYSHRIYESVQDGNTGHEPGAIASAGWWADIGPTNRWAMFDGEVGTATVADLSLEVTLAPGRADAIALMGVSAAEVRVEIYRSDGSGGYTLIYSKTEGMTSTDGIYSWWDYFFEEIKYKDYLTITGLTILPGDRVTLTFTRATGQVGCGMVIIGRLEDLGDVQRGVRVGISDYSVISRDEWGYATLIRRGYNKWMSLNLIVPNQQLDRLVRILSGLRAVPCLWIASDRFSSTHVYGPPGEFDVDMQYYNLSYCSLRIEGMI
jgi:hypothetical protein